MTPALAIVADDLTGAGDAAVQFACRSWSTRLCLRRGAGSAEPPSWADCGSDGTDVVAVSTDSRARAAAARSLTRDAVAGLASTGVEHLYLKIDSTLRGAVAEQVAGALDAWSVRHPDAFAVVCSAYPAMGRTVRHGRAWAGGMPLETGPAGRDPATPVVTSAVTALLPGSVHVANDRGNRPSARGLLASGHRVLAVDAVTAEDLDHVASAVLEAGPRAVPVGSAGLAAAFAEAWGGPARHSVPPREARHAGSGSTGSGRTGPVVVLTTSLHPVAQEQVRRMEAMHPGRVWALTPRPGDLADAGALASWLLGLRMPTQPPDVVLVTAPPPDGSAASPRPRQVAERLVDVVDHVHDRLGVGFLVLVGGDGAGTLLDRWRCAGIDVAGQVVEGVPQGILRGGRADGVPVATKAGGFGGPRTILEIAAWGRGQYVTGDLCGPAARRSTCKGARP